MESTDGSVVKQGATICLLLREDSRAGDDVEELETPLRLPQPCGPKCSDEVGQLSISCGMHGGLDKAALGKLSSATA